MQRCLKVLPPLNLGVLKDHKIIETVKYLKVILLLFTSLSGLCPGDFQVQKVETAA